LLVDVAARGCERFAQALATGWRGAHPDPAKAFESLGRAYLDFARNEPGYYAAMFDAGLPLAAYPALLTAGDRAFGVLRDATETPCARRPIGERPPVLMVALHVGAMAHGIASLFGRGDAARRRLPMSSDDLLKAGLLIYLRGLGLPG